MKHVVIGTAEQVALVDYAGDIKRATEICRSAKFSSGQPALVAANQICKTKPEAIRLCTRCQSALAYISGTKSSWITPSFVVIPLKDVK